jgi:hypothetical protein
LTENCVAFDATVLGIGDQGASIQPPAEWKFAKQSDRSVAVGSAGKSLITAVEITAGTDAAVIESLEKLTAASAIEKVKFEALKHRLKKPQITVDASGTPVDLWEISKLTSNGVSPELQGQGFVVVPDAEADAEKVMHAVQTLKGKP